MSFESSLDELVTQTDFSGVVELRDAERVLYRTARGWADRRYQIATRDDTQFAIASATKGLTALTVMSLVDDRTLALDNSVRRLLGPNGDWIDPAVTVEQVLRHTSGIGDYLDERVLTDKDAYVLELPVHRLCRAADYLPLLRGPSPQFAPGSKFSYCNSGYVLLALLAETVTGKDYHDLVDARVLNPAGMTESLFPRSDELPTKAAIGYMPSPNGGRTHHFHLPMRGVGDGGAYSTLRDFNKLWSAFFAGRIVAPDRVSQMTKPGTHNAEYGLGFWLKPATGLVVLEGCDAGISCQSGYHPGSGSQFTVMSNTSRGAWPVAKALEVLLPSLAQGG